MPQTPAVPAPPQPPAAPSVQGTATVGAPVAGAPPTPISAEQARFLRTRRDALSNQLNSAQDRRDEVAEQLRSDETQASERPGLQDRLRVLDDRLVNIEREIALNGEQLANAPPRGDDAIAVVSGRSGSRPPKEFNPNLATVLGFFLLVPFAIAIARRWFAPRTDRGAGRPSLEVAQLTERMDKMESAIDAVAIEVERIGEGQRFLTQSMTEITQRQNATLPVGGAAFDGVAVRDRDQAGLR